ncbi:MAG: hypothetical protein M1814_001541 [Vezdaea aestivalis]|nr:MAG: hypothetical protein M1814_001541 [Vezdaea aestivalis]
MLSFKTLSTVLALLTAAQTVSAGVRGLAYIPKGHPQDDALWASDKCAPIDWYYNWSANPVAGYKSLEYVPMLHGRGDAAGFATKIDQLRAQGLKINTVLFVNEPDGSTSTGGTAMSPQEAATIYKTKYQPLKAKGVRLGGPSTTSSDRGIKWQKDFLALCSDCTIDFMPLHWYGNFNGLSKWYLPAVKAAFPNTKFWMTEFANRDAKTTAEAASFLQQAIDLFDGDNLMERYSYFPAVRYGESNMPQVTTMLTTTGALSPVGQAFCAAPKAAAMRRFSKRITG